MICAVTWPNFKHGSERYGTQAIIDDCRAGQDVQYGKTKIFIRSPQTLFELEKRRTDKIPAICTTLQKVRLVRIGLHCELQTYSFFGPIPWGHSGPLCHALSLSSLLSMSWTSTRKRRATVPLATPGEWA